MPLQTIIFFGPSGSGKGTQAKLLIEKIKESDMREVLYVETGQRFRDFSSEASFTALKTKEIMKSGGLLPEFLPIWIWTEYFIRHISGDEHLILDGLSRRVHEAPILDSAMKFYGRENPSVVSLEVSRAWAKDRMINRGRVDDNIKDIEKRIDWYFENVLPAMEFFKNNSYYNFISINGEQSIENVHKEITSALDLK
ncbi:MAG: nucleoside monophosphate kinase [Minisyncoccia bacterium]